MVTKPSRKVSLLLVMLALASFGLAGCGDDDSGDTVDAAASDGAASDVRATDSGALRQNGETCGQSASGASCASGLICCYPCGIPNCEYRCEPRPTGGMCPLRP